MRFPQILVETGFAPEWVELQKEIRIQTEALRKELGKCRQFKTLQGFYFDAGAEDLNQYQIHDSY